MKRTLLLAALAALLLMLVGVAQAETSGAFSYIVIGDKTDPGYNKAVLTSFNSSSTTPTIPDSIDGHAVWSVGFFYNNPPGENQTSKPISRYYAASFGSSALAISRSGIYFSLNGYPTLVFQYAISGSSTITNTYVRAANTGITSAVIPEFVTGIADSGFENCIELTNVSIPQSVIEIQGYYAFKDCDALTKVEIPGSVRTIGNNVFFGCDELKSVSFENGVTSMGEGIFNNCPKLEELTLPGTIKTLIPENLYKGEQGKPIKQSLKKVEILDGLKTIGDSAFSGYTALTSMKLPDSITSIGESAFSVCSSLTEINLPESLETLGGSAFASCAVLPEITLPDSLTEIGSNPFPKSNELLKVGCASYARKWAQENGYPADAGQAGYRYLAVHTGKTKAEDAVYPTETKAGMTASVCCAACGDVVSGGTEVPPLSELSLLKLPEQLQRIREEAFMGCACEGVIVPDGCKVIGPRAFADCKDLLYIRIPKSVTSVAEDAFEGCGEIMIER